MTWHQEECLLLERLQLGTLGLHHHDDCRGHQEEVLLQPEGVSSRKKDALLGSP